MAEVLIIIIVAAAVIIPVVSFFLIPLIVCMVSASNKLNRAQVKIQEAASGIDVALQKRYDVLTKMTDVVKAYARHEKETLFEVINLRKDMTMQERTAANQAMDENMAKINVLAERYPELKSGENFITLQKAITNTEEHLQAARRAYNSNVSLYNQMLVSFPSSFIAKRKKLAAHEFFEAGEAKGRDVEIDL